MNNKPYTLIQKEVRSYHAPSFSLFVEHAIQNLSIQPVLLLTKMRGHIRYERSNSNNIFFFHFLSCYKLLEYFLWLVVSKLLLTEAFQSILPLMFSHTKLLLNFSSKFLRTPMSRENRYIKSL